MFGWFAKRSNSSTQCLNGDRYKGKPLLILLENYVLDCIGLLPPDKAANMLRIVQRIYGGGNDWKATLRATLHMDDSLDENMRAMWAKNQEIARQASQTLLPEQFARMVVDQNFSHMVG